MTPAISATYDFTVIFNLFSNSSCHVYLHMERVLKFSLQRQDTLTLDHWSSCTSMHYAHLVSWTDWSQMCSALMLGTLTGKRIGSYPGIEYLGHSFHHWDLRHGYSLCPRVWYKTPQLNKIGDNLDKNCDGGVWELVNLYSWEQEEGFRGKDYWVICWRLYLRDHWQFVSLIWTLNRT